jgi:hypothetical protein
MVGELFMYIFAHFLHIVSQALTFPIIVQNLCEIKHLLNW